MKRKYAVHPGWVYSTTDGDSHWISFNQLVRLYDVDPSECFVWDSFGLNKDNYIHLYPRRDGHYKK